MMIYVSENQQEGGRTQALTCDVENDDARVFSNLVGSHASVEGVSFSFLNLQRACNFLKTHSKFTQTDVKCQGR